MQDEAAPNDEGASDRGSSRRSGITLATAMWIVAAFGSACALVVQIHRGYAAIPPFSAPICPEVYATPGVLLWIVLASVATFAWRRSSVARLAAQIALSSLLVMLGLWRPSGLSSPNARLLYDVFWPVASFGVCVVAPMLIRRFADAGDSILLLPDSAGVALLTYVFAVEPFVPRM